MEPKGKYCVYKQLIVPSHAEEVAVMGVNWEVAEGVFNINLCKLTASSHGEDFLDYLIDSHI